VVDRLATVRKEEVARLKRQLSAAVRSIRHYKRIYPAINENDGGYYLDGSERRDFGSTGFAQPDFRMWQVGYISNGGLYIYQEIDRHQWKYPDDCSPLDIDVYRLAHAVPNELMYGGSRDGIRPVDLDTLAKDTDRYTLDMIITMSSALEEFFATEEAFRAAVAEFKKEVRHDSADKLVFV
jgi:hypothetical protein